MQRNSTNGVAFWKGQEWRDDTHLGWKASFFPYFWRISLGHVVLTAEMGESDLLSRAVIKIRRAAKPSLVDMLEVTVVSHGAPWGEGPGEGDRRAGGGETTLHLCHTLARTVKPNGSNARTRLPWLLLKVLNRQVRLVLWSTGVTRSFTSYFIPCRLSTKWAVYPQMIRNWMEQ